MIRSLRLFHFRNFTEQTTEFDRHANFFIGLNGQGKTNLLEAIDLLFTTESFRRAPVEHLVQAGESESLVQAQLDGFHQVGAIGTSADQVGAVGTSAVDHQVRLLIKEGRKSFSVDGKKVVRKQLLTLQPLVLFSPESLDAIKGTAEMRRQLVDELALFARPTQEWILNDYRKILRTRNQLLRNRKLGHTSEMQTQALLSSLEDRFLNLGTQLTLLRLQVLHELEQPVNAALASLGSSFPEVNFAYILSQSNAIHFSHTEIHNSMRDRLLKLRAAELAAGHSLVGPHRHDLVFLFGGKDSRFYCSQGQQRSLILAFKLAQIVYHRKALGVTPILLLDDVFSELDGEKRGSFVEMIKHMNCQIVITTTDFDLPRVFDSDKCLVRRIQGGRVV
ncbi:MAG: DNA replication and repair protein RecF [Bdellovibrio sp.]|nr:MAG: DNA replication and repair protein RecF [Bdellovibrio sp.]